MSKPNKGLWDRRIRACQKGVQRINVRDGEGLKQGMPKSYEDNLEQYILAFPHTTFLKIES